MYVYMYVYMLYNVKGYTAYRLERLYSTFQTAYMNL